MGDMGVPEANATPQMFDDTVFEANLLFVQISQHNLVQATYILGLSMLAHRNMPSNSNSKFY